MFTLFPQWTRGHDPCPLILGDYKAPYMLVFELSLTVIFNNR